VPPAGVHSGRELVGEIEEHLRALLRDVVCGYLKPELASMADEILLQSDSVEIHARDTRMEQPPAAHPGHAAAHPGHATAHPGHAAAHHEHAPAHPLDPPTTVAAPINPPTEQSLPPEHRSPAHPRPERGPATDPPATPHHERHQVREFMRPVALVPPEAEPRITRLVDVINDPAPAPAPAPTHEQPALVVDDFAWDLDDPDDYSAPA
jgi:hypothetical protein